MWRGQKDWYILVFVYTDSEAVLGYLGGIMGAIGSKRLAWLCYELGTMLDAGLSIRRALEVLSVAAKGPSLRMALRDVARRVEQGGTLEEAFGAHRAFPHLFVNMVAVGEESGTLDRAIGELARFYESQWRIRRGFIASVTPPVLQYVAAVAITPTLPLRVCSAAGFTAGSMPTMGTSNCCLR